jgi:pimeloyl-ACP methyl ester carboxylesterase
MMGKPFLSRHILKQALAQAFYPQAVPNSYLKSACALWLGRWQVKAYIEDESALNDSLKRMSERYSKIRVPIVIVTGDQDKILSANENAYRLHRVVPGSQLIELKETGHEIPQTHPESIYSALSLISQSKGEEVSSPRFLLSISTEIRLCRFDSGACVQCAYIEGPKTA